MTSPVLELLSVTQAERDKAKEAGNSLPDGSYPINNAHQLHAAAVLAASHHGDWKAAMALIRRRAKELGVDVTTLPGFGGAHSDGHAPGFELRRRHRLSMVSIRERRGMSFNTGNVEVRAQPNGSGGTTFLFEGYGSVFDSPFDMWDKWGDPYTEIVKQGAFTESLGRPDLDVPFLIGHNDAGIPLARTRAGTMQLAQDTHGLHVLARMDGSRSDVKDLASAVERGDLDEMSIGFITRGQQWSEDYETRNMLNMDVHRGDVSAVALGASQATAGSTMVALPSQHLSRLQPDTETAAADDPDGEDRMKDGTMKRLPMVLSMLDSATATFGQQDRSQFPQDVNQAIDLVGSADVHINHVVKAEGLNDSRKGEYAEDHPDSEERRNPIDSNLGDAPDYNVGPKVVPMACPQCGTKLKVRQGNKNFGGGDVLVKIDDSGLPSEEMPSAGLALAQARADLERRQRELQLLTLVS